MIILERMDGDVLKVIDTLELDKDNTFSTKVKNEEPMLYRLNFYNKQAINLIIDKTNIDVVVDGNTAKGQAVIEGSPDMDYLNEVNELASKFQAEMAPINQKFMQARGTGDIDGMKVQEALLNEKKKGGC